METEGELHDIFTDDTGVFVLVVIWSDDCSEEGNLTLSVSAWWPGQAELGLATSDAFVVAGQVGQEVIV